VGVSSNAPYLVLILFTNLERIDVDIAADCNILRATPRTSASKVDPGDCSGAAAATAAEAGAGHAHPMLMAIRVVGD